MKFVVDRISLALLAIFLATVNSQGTTSSWDKYMSLFRFGTCPRRIRCGLYNLNFPMIRGEPGTEECVEVCVWFPGLFAQSGYTCGYCDDVSPPVVPTPPVSPPAPKPNGGPIFPPNFQPPTDAPSTQFCEETDPRCLLDLAYSQYRGTQNTDSCEEICVFGTRIREGYSCGVCNSIESPVSAPVKPAPIPAPVRVPASAPIPAPVRVPASAPISAPATVPASAPITAPVGAPASAPITAPVQAPALAPITAPAPAAGASTFQIETDLVMDPSFEPAFVAAAARWQAIITGDLSSESTDGLDPPRPGCSHPAIVDDLYICGVLEPIDGEGNQVGFARPIYLRTDDTSLPFTGEMVFDSVDMAGLERDGLLSALILHEMCHVLGFGTIWTDLGLQDENNSACPYLGPIATQEFKAISGCDSVPVEQVGADATRCRHWSEECFVNELMTGTLDFDANPISRVTIGALEDMGYDVSYDSADDFTSANLDDTISTCVCNRRERERRSLWDGKHGDVFALRQKPGRMAPEISEELRNYAVKQGLKILEESSTGGLSGGGGVLGARDSNANYVGDKVVAVVVKDADGNYYSVVVLAPKP